MHRGNPFNDSGFRNGNYPSNFQGTNYNPNFNQYNSRDSNTHQAYTDNPMFRSGPSNFEGSSSRPQSMNNNLPYEGNQSQLELANQILKAVLSSTSSGASDRRRSRDRSPRYRSRSPDYRSRRSLDRRSPRRHSRSPHRRSYDKFETRRGRTFTPREQSFHPRGRFNKSRPPYRRFNRVLHDSKSDLSRKRSLSRDEGRQSRDRGDSDVSKRPKLDSSDENKPDKETSSNAPVVSKSKFPIDALFCHICNHGGFTSEDTYLFHLEGARHRKTANAFHEKNEMTLSYLRKNAKLAAVRNGRLDRSVGPYKCTTCHAVVRESFFSHKKLLEHRLVKKFLMPKCCGRIFRNHHDMDEHRLSLPHLKKVRQSNENKMAIMDTSEEDSDKKPDAIISMLKSRLNTPFEEIRKLKFIPPFDGNNMIGIEYLKPRPSVACEPCQMLLPSSFKALEGHLVSMNHYNNLTEFLKSMSKRKEKDVAEDKAESQTDADKKSDTNENEFRESDDEFFFDESQQIILEEVGEDIDDLSDEEEQHEIEQEKPSEGSPQTHANEDGHDRNEDEDKDKNIDEAPAEVDEN